MKSTKRSNVILHIIFLVFSPLCSAVLCAVKGVQINDMNWNVWLIMLHFDMGHQPVWGCKVRSAHSCCHSRLRCWMNGCSERRAWRSSRDRSIGRTRWPCECTVCHWPLLHLLWPRCCWTPVWPAKTGELVLCTGLGDRAEVYRA